jgi:hypothetical protein
VDTCDPQAGICKFAPLAGCCRADHDCKTSDGCRIGACIKGKCEYKPKTCDDKDACTTDSCDSKTGKCKFTPKDCDDKNACTSDKCEKGVCKYKETLCDDGNP